MNSTGSKPRRTHWFRYALGMLGYSIPGYMYSSQGTYFYNDKIGLSLAMIGVGTIFFSIWDAINDPLLGFLSDRTRTRFGRRKPWMLATAPLFGLFMILFFSPPGGLGRGASLLLYYTAFLMLTETANTVLTTNYHALLPELFIDIGERARANGTRQVLSLVGMIAGVVLTPMIVRGLGYRTVAIAYAAIGVAIYVYSTMGTHENPEYQDSAQPGLVDSFRAVIGNVNFLAVGAANFFYQAANGLIMAVIPFFVKYVLDLPDAHATYLTAAVFVTAIPSVLVWSALARSQGVLKTWRMALLVFGLGFLPMLIVGSLIPAILSGVWIGFGLGGVIANLDLVNAAIIDEDARKSGLRREAIYQSTISFVIRFSGLLRSLVFILVAVIFGFHDRSNPGPTPELAARSMLSVFPLILMVLSFAASFFVRPVVAGASVSNIEI
ncbi:MAG: MFS transporter [Spirochaetales bacterium]|nr:MFS transporter [Spirochaetales bacterium]